MKKILRCIGVILLLVMMFQFSGHYLVFADVNNEYHPITPTEPGHGSSNWAIDVLGKVASTILDWVSKFVLAVANLAEKLITNFTTWLFGVDIFPWEDLIVFNNLPYLDANFLNPALGSIFRVKVGEGENTAIKDIVRSVYFSLLTLSLSIVGIGVAVASIKLAISTIAADKARYKETIVKCLYTVILLFTVHILISFMLYLNETICVGASQMLKNFVKDEIKLDVTDKDREKVNKFVKYNSHPYEYIEEAKKNSDAFGGYKLEVALEDLLTFDKDNRKREGEKKGKEYDGMDAQGKEIAAYLYKQSEYRAKRFENYTWITHNCELEVENKLLGTNSTKECIDALGDLLSDTFTVLYASSEQEVRDKSSGDVENHMVNAYKIVKAGENIGTIISNLGAEFRNQAYEITQDNKDGVIIAVYLYAIMLIQSIMLLITYIKRVFYILILSVIAPVVVIYDFFMGNGKNKIFSVWIKELATLIFVQSLQALLMTVMLAVVIKLYLTASDESVAQQSMGVYAIFIMALIPKIELLVKKIFGLGSGVMDDTMMGGKRSLLKTGLALKLGSSVLNNAGKVIGGVGMMAGAGLAGIRQNRIAKNNDEAAKIKGETNKLKLGNRSSNNNSSALNRIAGDGLGNYSLDDLTSAIKTANAPDYDELNRQKKHEIMQRGLKGLQQATSGIVETGGAMAGAAVGATIGLGTGGDDVFQDMLIGAGLGDKAGHLVTDLTIGTLASANEIQYQYGVGKREVQKSKKQVVDAKKAQDEYNELIEKAKTQNRVPGGNTTRNVSSANLNVNESTPNKSQNSKQQIVKNNPNRVNSGTRVVEPPKAASQNNKSNIKNVSNVSSNISNQSKASGNVKQNNNNGNSNPISKASSSKEKKHFTSNNETRSTQSGPITNGSNENNNPIRTGNNKQNRRENNNFTGTGGVAQNNPNTSNSAANDRINRNNIDDISNI